MRLLNYKSTKKNIYHTNYYLFKDFQFIMILKLMILINFKIFEFIIIIINIIFQFYSISYVLY